MHFKYALLVKDGVPNLRNEDVEIVETNDTPPPVPDAPSRIPYATPIHEEDEDDTHPINKSTFFFFFTILDYFYSANLDFSHFHKIC